jgi:hypothetical protein
MKPNFFLYFALMLLYACPLQAQTLDSTQVQIPLDWIGIWAGKLEISLSNGTKQTVPMQLHIAKHDSTDRWAWTIIYGEGEKRQERKYQLIAQNSTKGWYKIDEKNGIILDAFFAQGTLASTFEVENNLIMSLYRKAGKLLVFEIFMCVTKSPNLTGGNAKDIPPVKSYPVRTVHKASLKKLK